MKPLYIFDLDGTLALIEHRRHYVEGEKKDWPSFFAECVNDPPNLAVVKTLKMLYISNCDIWVWSGRSDLVKQQTIDWLFSQRIGHMISMLEMRNDGDHQPDEKLKAIWLSEMCKNDRERLVAIFEDRDRMVKLWRDNGIACFQVAPGAF
jgi:hypothetical protein